MNFLHRINDWRINRENQLFESLRVVSMPLARISFFIMFFWFGVLKMLELSPATGVIHTIHAHTAAFIPWQWYVVLFGMYESLIGLLFLMPGRERWALYLLVPHVLTTFAPLVLLPKLVWKGFLIPNLIGQYILKNLVIVALAMFMASYVSSESASVTKEA